MGFSLGRHKVVGCPAAGQERRDKKKGNFYKDCLFLFFLGHKCRDAQIRLNLLNDADRREDAPETQTQAVWSR